MENLQGKTAFITGAASGIGLGIAKACGRAGMNVVIADIRKSSIDEVLPFFKKRGWPVYGIELDVTDREGYEKAADEVQGVFGNVHLLVNNAGVEVSMVPVWENTYKDMDFMTDVCFLGVLNGIKTFVPRMLAHGEDSHVVSTASQSGMSVVRGATLYCAIKAGIVAMMETIATDLQGKNVGASAFIPGPVLGNLSKTSHEVRQEQYQQEEIKPAAPAAPPPPPPKMDIDMSQYDFNSLTMPAVEAGERVVRGVRRGDLYIFTHVEMSAGVREKCEAILRGYPDEPVNPARQKLMNDLLPFLMTNPVYTGVTKPPALALTAEEWAVYED